MRAILIIVVTMALLAGAFFAVVSWQAKPASLQGSTGGPRLLNPATLPTSRPVMSPDVNQKVGAGERVWVQSFDQKTGELSNEFYAEKYTPVSGDTVDVVGPQAKFYLGKSEPRQLLIITGSRGRVLIPNAGNRDKLKGGASAPTRGDLQDVVIELFQHVGDAQPQVICVMPNASFDNDQFRIFTDAYQDEKGDTIAGDQVPVHVTGEYEFDGKGLEIRWNERDRRLQSLEIAHGNRLVIHDVSSLKLGAQHTAVLPLPDALVDADPKALPPSVKKKKKKHAKPVPGRNEVQRDHSNPVYRATFFDNVKIFEAEQPIGDANQLLVDFLMNLSQKPATQPGTSPTTSTARIPKADDEEFASLDSKQDEQKLQGPITVRWTGRLLVTPVEEPDTAPDPGETNIALVGSPVKIDRQGSQIVGARITYRTSDSGFTADADDKTPQVMLTDARGMKITTTSIDYGGIGEPAILEGKSHAEIPVQGGDPAKPPQIVKADWNESCTLTLAGDSLDALQIQHADLKGEVTIDHPQMHGRSDGLNLQFEPESSAPTTQPTMNIRELTASGKVEYVLTNEQQQQSIQAESLSVLAGKTAEGKFYASAMNASGNVHTQDGERQLFADRLAVKLAPSTQPSSDPANPSFDVESLQAESNVRVVTVNGQTATGDHLSLTTRDGARQVELIGSPNAMVADTQSTIVGPTIRFDPDAGNASVVGAGSLSALQKTAGDAKARRITASWQGGLQLRGKENLATINGPVTLIAPSEDGSVNTAVGLKLIIHLADAPATQPTTKAIAGLGDVSGFSNKIIQSYSLQDKVEVRSVLSDVSGTLLRRMHLFTDILNYDQQSQKLIIPGAGRMLVEDNRGSSTPATNPTLLGDASMRGATAFEWQRELTYDEPGGRVEFAGSVRVVHQGSGEAPFEVTADTMSADIARGKGDPTDRTQVDVKKLNARGSVMFTSTDMQFNADEVEYDPATHLLIAKAMPGRFAELFYQTGISRGSFSELIFNTETNSTESMKDFRATVAR